MLSIFKSKGEPGDKRPDAAARTADKAPAEKAPVDKREPAPASRPSAANGKPRPAAVTTAPAPISSSSSATAAVASSAAAVASSLTPAANAAGISEQRGAVRREAARVPSITGVRISPYGAQAMLVNISESGILVECSVRMQHGNAVTVNFEGTFSPRTVEGRVARHCVAAMGRDGALRYHAGIAFNERINLGDEEPSAEAPEAAPVVVVAAPAVPTPIVRNRW
jgi:hypothetical protein